MSVSVTPVNDAPIAQAIGASTDEDAPVTLDLVAQASDIEGSVLTSMIVAGPVHGTLAQNVDGTWTYTPEADWNGEDSFSYKVSDGELDSVIATVSLTVAPVNDAPVIAPRSIEIDEDTPLTVDLLAGASDVDGDSLTVTIARPPLHGRLDRNLDGTWTYVPDADWNGTDSLDYEVSDGTASTSTRVTFIVKPVNDAPVIADLALATLEDVALTLAARAWPLFPLTTSRGVTKFVSTTGWRAAVCFVSRSGWR